MAYPEFTLESVEADLGIAARPGRVFPALRDVEPPAWLPGQLARGMELALVSEKARSEFIVAPILLAVRELSGGRVAILSGPRLDVDPARRLAGECDFSCPGRTRCRGCGPRSSRSWRRSGTTLRAAWVNAPPGWSPTGCSTRGGRAGPAGVRVRDDRRGLAIPPARLKNPSATSLRPRLR